MRVRAHGRNLAEALRADLAEWTERTGSAVEIWALPEGAVPPRASRAVSCVVSMVLSAVERHDLARSVSLAVTVAPSGLRLTVSFDTGVVVGAPPLPVPSMRAAFAEADGTLNVTVATMGGITVNGAIAAARLR
ncbi:hypothetical protein [Nonomuraea sp. SBT364]|uniref:hypothetical protein n=1 Tax=Nonomuraea sp. SBT364 TaxID=1580530 RepID=UPI0012E10B2A|nr:hypothetical protein [Nonomuraea sp. SBT364]